MRQLKGTKCSFLLCLGMSIIICSVIYMRARVPTELKLLEPPSCRPFSAECKALLPGAEDGVERNRRGCQVRPRPSEHADVSTVNHKCELRLDRS